MKTKIIIHTENAEQVTQVQTKLESLVLAWTFKISTDFKTGQQFWIGRVIDCGELKELIEAIDEGDGVWISVHDEDVELSLKALD